MGRGPLLWFGKRDNTACNADLLRSHHCHAHRAVSSRFFMPREVAGRKMLLQVSAALFCYCTCAMVPYARWMSCVLTCTVFMLSMSVNGLWFGRVSRAKLRFMGPACQLRPEQLHTVLLQCACAANTTCRLYRLYQQCQLAAPECPMHHFRMPCAGFATSRA